ncbi:MAG: UDP-N-acetylmuramate--L-alanine ligase [Candidatus Marinimicrobia bacterium]|jgi:UDP-N-acetylmuramate--alanine ligase|nr:UDP-N-acetylmuramate--L-alanine ligase [Candidatus Neomarinimicrobiota bacterium]MDP6592606.1 UDP-N-acetylmuramate--L-alanine ligase [Candidatus Neomarinimicrobiota bacterium]MDP6836663.1 UDP-N-acetylmuramate--L-alanine ligase [Candidatus Neomarinimicrobiota bacterium]MDP6967468.1 UDP-N-acetylmuramate--L-alanine ligase [Candidatus Neomarinimicrobiota bacterium]|tara:strand:+ start:10255 stop:11643 length:1389 start_codon:yes stop_codon:yes gene_type:complete
MFGKIRKVHFVGIGGIGMSGIAELLLNLGFNVSGSDLKPSEITKSLRQKGAVIFEGHGYDNINDSDMLVYSSAVNMDNPEVQAARDRGIPVIRRAEMLGELLKLKAISIAIGGTHGKTTTTSMMGAVLTAGELDPTIVVGGVVKSLNVNALLGAGDVIVVEADEFDKSFLQLSPTYAVITNIDSDHMDCYDSQEDLLNAFTQFANAVPFYGTVVACTDEPLVKKIVPNISRPVVTYGFTKDADFRAEQMEYREIQTDFVVKHKNEELGSIQLQVPGAHNVKNALAVIGLSFELDINFDTIRRGLKNFSGVRRRFEIKGIFNDIMVVDDYAHHPTEVSATLKAVKNGWERRLVSVFQPHLYTRTRDFYEDFARAFLISDVLIVTDVYPAREEPIEGVSGELIVNAAKSMGHKDVHWVKDKKSVVAALRALVNEGDLVITLGAGDIWRMGDQYVAVLQGEKIEV